MAITININSIDRSSIVNWDTLRIEENISNIVDTAFFTIKKFGSRTYNPTVGDDIEILNGTTKVFAGEILSFNERVEASKGVVYDIECIDWRFLFDSQLVSESYEDLTITEIIEHIVTNYTTGGFTTNNVTSGFTIEKIVFNRVTPSACLKKLSEIVNYEWYIDEDKDIHFIAKFSETAPYDLQDDSGNYIYKSLARSVDGSQLANTVYVRGGEYNAETYTDDITVSGSDTKSFLLPYKFANLTIQLDTGAGFVAQTLGIDFIEDFTTVDVLYNYAEKTIRWEAALAAGDIIRFSGNPKVPVLAVAADSVSIAEFGTKEKLIRDTSIEDLDTARRRASAELNVYAEEVEDAKFRTYTTGLRTGMTINLTSTERNCNTDFIIKKVTSTADGSDRLIYSVELVTTKKYEFIELLQSLLEPEPRQSDADEVAEKIEVDTQTISITELIEVTSAVEDLATITVTEDIRKDPLGAGVEPTWVYGPYVPSPWPTDTKRVALYDRDIRYA